VRHAIDVYLRHRLEAEDVLLLLRTRIAWGVAYQHADAAGMLSGVAHARARSGERLAHARHTQTPSDCPLPILGWRNYV